MPEQESGRNVHGYPIYPKGTLVAYVDVVDRGQKMIFQCELHPENGEWASKNPIHSAWFGDPEKDPCNCPLGRFRLSHPYSPTRND